jgi:hypothetical protein
MIPGHFCTIDFNGSIKNYEVKEDNKGELYITRKGKKYTELQMPMGKEVEI